MTTHGLRVLCVIIGCLLSGLCHAGDRSGAQGACTRVLFIGNSLTYVNDLPRTFSRYTEARYPGVHVCTEMVASGGATLADHHKSGDASSRLNERKWDYVVIQEGRDTLPGGSLNGTPFYLFPAGFVSEASFFSQAARDAGATPILFETWSKEEDAFDFMEAAFSAAQATTGALVAPIGRVWNGVVGQHGMKLLRPDGSHPSEQGTLLAAMTLARTIFGEAKGGDVGVDNVFDSDQLSAIEREISATAASSKALQPARPVKYSEIPTLQPSDPLDLHPGDVWEARTSGFRYSLGSAVRVDRNTDIAILNYVPSGAVHLSIKGQLKEPAKLTFETLTGGVTYSVEVIRKGEHLTVLTSYQSDATHRVFSINNYSPTRDDAYFDKLEALYARLASEEKQAGLAQALSQHYARLRDFLGPDGLTQATAGFGLDEWDCIMLAWVYQDAGELGRAADYLRAAVTVFPNSVSARLSLADLLVAQGKRAEAIEVLKEAASKSWSTASEAQQVTRKLESILDTQS